MTDPTNQFSLLEEKISELINYCNALKEENAELRSSVADLESKRVESVENSVEINSEIVRQQKVIAMLEAERDKLLEQAAEASENVQRAIDSLRTYVHQN